MKTALPGRDAPPDSSGVDIVGRSSGVDIVGRDKTYGLSPGDVARLVQTVAQAAPDNVQAVAASQLGLLLTYHQIVLAQSRRSFAWALTGAVAGLAFFIAAAGYTLWTGEARAAVIPVVSGAVVEVVAGIVFFLYGKTTSQMGDFYGRLERLQRYLLANSICESLQGEERDKTRSDLIREIAQVTLRPPKPE
jgi:hypothetical protein